MALKVKGNILYNLLDETTGAPMSVKKITSFPDSAPAPGATYSQSDMQAILDEVRDLKDKLRDAGLLGE